jgi:lactoylglutathione lyase
MRIAHVALWVRDLEAMRSFYEQYFGARAGPRYENQAKRFQSYFLSFAGGAQIELMHRPDIPADGADPLVQRRGFIHLALEVGDEADVDRLSKRIAADGFPVLDGPRRTGDGYYETVVLDPEGNRLELTARRNDLPSESPSS